jgi:hypothetical protein
MDLTKRLGFSDDILNTAASVLEGKKISHPNQKEISAAAPPEDEITAADFKALKAKKKMHRVEGFDRNKKRYESPLFETYEDALAFFNKVRKSAPLTNLKIVEFSETVQEDIAVEGKAYRVDVKPEDSSLGNESETVYAKDRDDAAKKIEGRLKRTGRKDPVIQRVQNTDYQLRKEAKELNTANANDARAHDCAKHVVHEQWGVGETVPTMHAEPDAEGNIAWYDVMFEHGIEHRVATSDLEITLSETHVHKKSKRMNEQEQHGGKKIESLKTKKLPNGTMNPEQTKEEVENVDEAMDKSMAYATGTKQAMKMTGDEPPLEKSTIKKAHKIAKAILRKEEVELEEGRKAGVVGSVLSNPAAREHFKKLTGKEPSYFHISKNPEHAQAALNHAAKAKAPEGEKPAEAGDDDTEANKHPINQLRGIADRNGGKFMGKQITRAHATKLISMHDDLKPAQKLDFVSNIGKHLAKVTS